MRFLPYEHYTIKTNLKKDEILNLIKNSTDEFKTFRWFFTKNVNPYEGKIDGNSFQIRRIIRYRNSFLPTIYGTIDDKYGFSIIDIKMKMHSSTIVLLCIWFGMIISFITIKVTYEIFTIKSVNELNPAMGIPFVMLLLGYLLTIGSFKFESIKAKKYLAKFFNINQGT